MKLKFEFTAEIIEDIGDVQPSEIYTAEQNKAMVENILREACDESAEINISNVKVTKIT